MGSRFIPAVLIALLVVLHGQLWFGRGSIHNVALLQQKLTAQTTANDKAQLANDRLASEVHDLKEGLETVEEKARFELGMVRPNEIFVQVAGAPGGPAPRTATPATGKPAVEKPAASPTEPKKSPAATPARP